MHPETPYKTQHTMNSVSFPSPTQSLFTSSFSSFPSHTSFKFNTNPRMPHLSTKPRNITTTKAAATATAVVSAPKKETLYDLLGISEDVTDLSDIKRAYKKMALKYHPDVSPPDRVEEYTTRFIRVQEAYETLSDPEARFMYDGRMTGGFVFSGKRETRFDQSSDNKGRWKGMWKEQVSELQRRDTAGRGMSWATRVRMQRAKSGGKGSDLA